MERFLNRYSEGDVVEITKDLPFLRHKTNRSGIVKRIVDGYMLEIRPSHMRKTILLYSNEVNFLYKRY